MDSNNLNKYLERVQVGRFIEVPVESLTSLWYIWYCRDGSWDSATSTQFEEIIKILPEVNEIFAVWHGNHRTNLFLMDKEDLSIRLQKMLKDKQRQTTRQRKKP